MEISLPVLKNSQKVTLGDFGDKQFDSVWLSLTYRCNNDCVYCYAGGHNKGKDMSFERAKNTTNLLKKLGVKHITFMGSEASLYPEIERITEYVSSKNMVTGMVTNGRKFSYKPFAKQMKLVGLRGVGITILGGEDSHDKITRVKGSYNQALRGIENCLSEGIDVTINSTITQGAIDQLEQVLNLTERMGLRKMFLNVCTDLTGGHNYSMNPIEAANIAKNFIETNRNRKGLISLTTTIPMCNFEELGEEYYKEGIIGGSCCVFGENSFAVDFNGDVLVCPHFTGYPLFNIFEKGEILDADEFRLLFFGGDNSKNFRNSIWNFPSQKCYECSNYGVCTGGCPIYWQKYNPEHEIKGGPKCQKL